MERIDVRCCIAGGGPAGMMLGFLLARAGVDVVVLEKHADFFRDFRGDTVHPSTLEVIYELGLLDAFLRLPHQEIRTGDVQIGSTRFRMVDLRHVPTHCKFLVLMPQWDLLNFLRDHAARYSRFRLVMSATVIDLLIEGGRVAGVRATTPSGDLEVRADLTIGADGRHSTVRERAGLEILERGVPIDVLWLRVSRSPGDGEQPLGRIDTGSIFVMFNRAEYWQCAYVIPKGGFEGIRARGLDAFRTDLARLAPVLRDRVDEIRSWDDVKLLTVKIDRLREWYREGLLCIGDAAHAMSPIGGVGINLAIQDAVAAANILTPDLQKGTPPVARLRAVQRRRELPTKLTQGLQAIAQDRIIGRVLHATTPLEAPWPVRLFTLFPFLQRIPAHVIGVGFRPEYVRTTEAPQEATT